MFGCFIVGILALMVDGGGCGENIFVPPASHFSTSAQYLTVSPQKCDQLTCLGTLWHIQSLLLTKNLAAFRIKAQLSFQENIKLYNERLFKGMWCDFLIVCVLLCFVTSVLNFYMFLLAWCALLNDSFCASFINMLEMHYVQMLRKHIFLCAFEMPLQRCWRCGDIYSFWY
jgi:hypothetical protein